MRKILDSKASEHPLVSSPTASPGTETKNPKLKLVLLVCGILIGIGVFISIFYFFSLVPDSKPKEYTEAVRTISSFANLKIDPCQDFYEYACGNFIKAVPKPLHKKSWGSYSWVKEQTNKKLHYLLVSKENTNSEAVVKMKKYYKSCLQMTYTHLPILDEVIKKMGGWALIGEHGTNVGVAALNWIQSTWTLSNVLEVAASYNTFPLLKFPRFLIPEPFVKILVPPLTFNGPQSKDSMAFKAYRQTVLATLQLITLKHSVRNQNLASDIDEQIEEMWDFETLLRELMQQYQQFPDPISINEVKSVFEPWLDLEKFLLAFYKTKFNSNDKIILKDKIFFQKLSVVISNTKKRTLSNYMVWSVVRVITTDVTTQFYSAQTLLDSLHVSEKTEIQTDYDDEIKIEEPIWEKCVEEVVNKFKFAIASIFIRKYVPPSYKRELERMYGTLIKIAKKNKPWFFDKETWKIASQKLSDLDPQMAYPPFILNNTKLDEYYEPYKAGSNYMENTIRHRQFLSAVVAREYGPGWNSSWLSSPVEIQIMILLFKKEIHAYSGMFQPPLHFSSAPREVKWGGLGIGLGHELSHSSLPPGTKFNREGLRKPWWSDDTAKNYQGVEDCYVKTFSGFEMFNKTLNGKISLMENTADSAGLWLAYQGLLQSYGGKTKGKKELEKRTKLPGFDLTRAQLFFLSYAQKLCKVYDENDSKHIFNSLHTFNNLRMLGTLMNSQEFSIAFKCSSKSPLNPPNKCHIY